MEIQRTRGPATTILFPLVERGGVDFESTPVTFAAADTQISKDEGTFANTTNTPAHEGNGMYSLALTIAEMQAERIMITCIDSATKLWEDQAIIINTQRQEVNVREIQNSTALSDTLSNMLVSFQITGGLFQGGSTTTALVLSTNESTIDDFYNGLRIVIGSGAAAQQIRRITDYAGSTRTATLDTALTTSAPASGDAFIIGIDYQTP